MVSNQLLEASPRSIPAVDGLDDASKARVVLFQAGKIVHAPALSIGLQPSSETLTAFAALSGSADQLPYFTGASTFALTTLTAAGRAFLDDPDAATQKTTLGLGTGDSPTFTGLTLTGALAANGGGTLGDVSGDVVTIKGTTVHAFSSALLNNTNASDWQTDLGLGTMASQAANNVAITGGAINGTTIGASTPAAGTFTTLTANSANATFANPSRTKSANSATGQAVHQFIGSTSTVFGYVGYGSGSNLEMDVAQQQNAALNFYTNNALRWFMRSAGSMIPGTDNAYSVGESGLRTSAIWSANGTIQTSDINQKIVEAVLDVDTAGRIVDAIEPFFFKWKVGRNDVTPNPEDPKKPFVTPRPGTRNHLGISAQAMKAALDQEGIDCGVWGLSDVNDPSSEQWIRPDQAIWFLWSAMRGLRREIAELRGFVAAQTF